MHFSFKSLTKSALNYAYEEYALRVIKKNKFWFIDIPRTSSTSIRIDISQKFGSIYGKKNVNEADYSRSYPVFTGHLPAINLRDRFGEAMWTQIFTFTLVRNPWDRFLSLYNYRRKHTQFFERRSTMPTFEEYVYELASPRYKLRTSLFSNPAFYLPQCDFIFDENNNSLVDFVGKFEERDKALSLISKNIGFSLGNHNLQSSSGNDDYSYRSHYTNETRDIIASFYKDDIAHFKYSF